MDSLDRIQIDPGKMNGQPCIRNTRLTVRRVLGIIALYKDREEIRSEFPEIDDEDIRCRRRSKSAPFLSRLPVEICTT